MTLKLHLQFLKGFEIFSPISAKTHGSDPQPSTVSLAVTEGGLTLSFLLMSWEKPGKEQAMKFTDDTNLGGTGNRNSRRKSRYTAEGEGSSPGKC